MSSRASKIVAALALLVCLLCPILELFDNWDHTEQTGDDTEYTFVVLGLCVGVTYAFALFALAHPARKATSENFPPSPVHESLSRCMRTSFFLFSNSPSPPVLTLRI
jgi:hypothetical protein